MKVRLFFLILISESISSWHCKNPLFILLMFNLSLCNPEDIANILPGIFAALPDQAGRFY